MAQRKQHTFIEGKKDGLKEMNKHTWVHVGKHLGPCGEAPGSLQPGDVLNPAVPPAEPLGSRGTS